MNFKQWLLISEMAKISIESLNTKSLQALSENSTDYNLKARYKFLISEWDKKKNTLTPRNVKKDIHGQQLSTVEQVVELIVFIVHLQ